VSVRLGRVEGRGCEDDSDQFGEEQPSMTNMISCQRCAVHPRKSSRWLCRVASNLKCAAVACLAASGDAPSSIMRSLNWSGVSC